MNLCNSKPLNGIIVLKSYCLNIMRLYYNCVVFDEMYEGDFSEIILLWSSKKSLYMWALTESYSLNKDVSGSLCKGTTFHFIGNVSSWGGWRIRSWKWMAREVVMLPVYHPISWESQESTEKTEIIQKIPNSALGIHGWAMDWWPLPNLFCSCFCRCVLLKS